MVISTMEFGGFGLTPYVHTPRERSGDLGNFWRQKKNKLSKPMGEDKTGGKQQCVCG